MFRATVLAATTMFAAVLQAASAAAAEYGTAAEARAMLDQAVIEMKADPAAAIVKFNDPDGAFRDRDLYVFCANVSDGVLVAHPNIVGTDLRTLKDVNGKPFGAEMLDGATRRRDHRGELRVAPPRRRRSGAEELVCDRAR